MSPTLRVAACHVSPIFLSAARTTQKCISLIHEASRGGANLVIFPETYIPAFPVWSALMAPAQNHAFFSRMAAESIYADGEEMRAIRQAARQTRTMISVGISEKVRYSSATLFNSNMIIGADGEVRTHHRKLVPTFFEKLTWSPGDGDGLEVVDLPLEKKDVDGNITTSETAKVGMLICGENTNPLARYTLMAQGEQVHISTWPAIWPTRMLDDSSPETSSSTAMNYDNLAANKTRAAAHCFEAKAFGILVASHLSDATINSILEISDSPTSSVVASTLRNTSRAASMFLDPTGALFPGFTVDPATGERKEKDLLQMEEGILYAELDLERCVEGKQYHDVVGGYQRLDIFDLRVNRGRKGGPITFDDGMREGKLKEEGQIGKKERENLEEVD